MSTPPLLTDHLELRPLPAAVAAVLPDDRETAAQVLRAPLDPAWPDPHLHGLLRRQAGAAADAECFGIWVMIERDRGSVVGDIGFHGPPDDSARVEIGYSVIERCRGRGYAGQAAAALVEWAASRPDVALVVAGCDPGNIASIRTLERVGFRRTGQAGGELRWERPVGPAPIPPGTES